jgi:hypothetical protein
LWLLSRPVRIVPKYQKLTLSPPIAEAKEGESKAEREYEAAASELFGANVKVRRASVFRFPFLVLSFGG